jgi:hypothetical protein
MHRVVGYMRGLPGQAATEDIEMFTRRDVYGRAAVMATIAAVALTAVEPSPAKAGSAPSGKGLSTTATSDATDFSAGRRYYRGGGAAAAAAFAGIVGTGLAIAATQNRRAYYDDSYGYYGGGPAYYGGGPAYYGGGPAYYGGGPDYYGGGPYYSGGYGYRSGVPRFRGHPIAGW